MRKEESSLNLQRMRKLQPRKKKNFNLRKQWIQKGRTEAHRKKPVSRR
jgi:hypothetical protein